MRFLNSLRIVPLVIGFVLIGATINDLIAQPLHVILYKKHLPISTVMAAFTIPFIIFGLVCGRVVDHFGPKKLLLLFLPAWCGTLTLYPLAQTTGDYMFVRAINAMFHALVVLTIAVYVRFVTTANHKAQTRMLSVIQASSYVGSGAGMYAGIVLTDHLSFLWPTVTALGILGTCMVFWSMMLIHPLERKKLKKGVAWIKNGISISIHETKHLVEKKAFLITLPGIGVSMAYLAFLTYFAIYVGGSNVGAILLLATVANGVASLTFIRKLIEKRGCRSVMVGSILLLVVSILMIRAGTHFWLLLVAGILFGIGFAGCSLSMSIEITQKVSRNRLAAGQATFNFLRQMAGVAGIYYSEWLWGVFGPNMWLFLIPLLVIAISLVFILKKRLDSEDAKPLRHVEREIVSLEAKKFNTAWSAFQGDTHSYKLGIAEIEWKKNCLRETTEFRSLPPALLVKEANKVSLALGLLTYLKEMGVSWLDGEIKPLRNKLLNLLKQIDRLGLRACSLSVALWKDEDSAEEYLRLVEHKYWKILQENVDKQDSTRWFLLALRVLEVLEPARQEYLEREIEKKYGPQKIEMSVTYVW